MPVYKLFTEEEYQLFDAKVSPRMAGIATFMRLPHIHQPAELQRRGAQVAIVGIPFDDATTYRSGARFGPRAVREMSVMVRPYNAVQDVIPFETLGIADFGDVNVVPGYIEETYQRIEEAIAALLAIDVFPVVIGGDHSLSLPVLRAQARKYGKLGMIHFDAHTDMYDTYFGKRYTHGTPFLRAVEEGLLDPEGVIQIGLRGPLYSREDYDFPRKNGVKMIRAEEVFAWGVERVIAEIQERAQGRKCYVSLDIDSLDPAFAPGTGTPEVFGLTNRELISFVRSLRGLDIVGFDLVEISPPYDTANITALLGANLVFEFLCTLPDNPNVKREG
ncbi:MAG: agmatinase [Nitrospinota bacterium]|nr:MAG: agmatinase [Nitrospinota bacterium]